MKRDDDAALEDAQLPAGEAEAIEAGEAGPGEVLALELSGPTPRPAASLDEPDADAELDGDELGDDDDDELDDDALDDDALDDDGRGGGPLEDEVVVALSDPRAEAALDEAVAALRGSGDLVADLEALLFSTHSPLAPAEIGETFGLTLEEVQRALIDLEQRLVTRGGPVALFRRPKHKRGKKLDGPPAMGFLLDVKAAFRKNVAPVGRPVLSPALTETLALVALNQPLSQSRLVREKGSTVYEHVKDLVARGWVAKHREGRSYALRTTEAFAAEFGLDNDPTLIKRALARAAGAEGAEEVLGSERIAFAAGDVDLAAEAASGRAAFTSVVPRDLRELAGPAPDDEPAGPTPEQVQAAIEAVHADGSPASESCLVSGGEAPLAPRPELRAAFEAEARGGAAPSLELPAAISARLGRPPSPPAADELRPARRDVRPAPEKLARAFQEEPMTAQPTPARDPRAEEPAAESAPPSRLSHLLELIEDDATTDDW